MKPCDPPYDPSLRPHTRKEVVQEAARRLAQSLGVARHALLTLQARLRAEHARALADPSTDTLSEQRMRSFLGAVAIEIPRLARTARPIGLAGQVTRTELTEDEAAAILERAEKDPETPSCVRHEIQMAWRECPHSAHAALRLLIEQIEQHPSTDSADLQVLTVWLNRNIGRPPRTSSPRSRTRR